MQKKILLYFLIASLTGCALFETQEAAPVVDLQSMTPVMHGIHTVQPGESLYAIAWRYGRDYRDIAIANNILPPYKIYPGQKLSLQKPRHSYQQRIDSPKEAQKKVPSLSSSTAVLKKAPAEEKAPPIMAPNKTVPLTTQKSQPTTGRNQSFEKATNSNLASSHKWEWPVKGKIIRTFATQTSGVINKGIDIAGELGTPIKAAGAGKVVYSGAGLRGYGQLIIIKHNDTFLSAYAHNHEILVKEGEVVKQGQIIAKMGKTDADQVKLHFEIRKNGQPINPLDFLPGS